ncbi:hypothetical protein [Halorubrum trueperi]
MGSPSLRTLLVAAIGGVAHLGIVEFLFRRLDHAPDSLWPFASVTSATFVFAFGFLVVLCSAHTRLRKIRGESLALQGGDEADQ